MNAPVASALQSWVGTVRSSTRKHYPHLVRDLALIFLALVVGSTLASLFKWDSGAETITITAYEIFLHNVSMALVTVLLARLGATILIVLNGLWLGMGLVAGAVAHGLPQTIALTVVHVPLELIAWALTLQCARVAWPNLVTALHKDQTWIQAAHVIGRILFAPIVFYVLAAIAEWAELALLER